MWVPHLDALWSFDLLKAEISASLLMCFLSKNSSMAAGKENKEEEGVSLGLTFSSSTLILHHEELLFLSLCEPMPQGSKS